MKTASEPEITCNLRQCQEAHTHESNGIARLVFVAIGLVVLGWVLYTTPERFREYQKANQAQNEQNAEKAKDQADAPEVVHR